MFKLIGRYKSNQFEFYSSDNENKIKIAQVRAEALSKGFFGNFDLTKVVIQTTDSNYSKIRVSLTELHNQFGISYKTLIYSVIGSYFGISPKIESLIQNQLNTPEKIKAFAQNYLRQFPVESTNFKLSRKVHTFLTNSYVVERTTSGNYFHKCLKEFSFGNLRYKNKVIGAGGMKTATGLQNLESDQKTVLAISQKGYEKFLTPEIKYHEDLYKFPHIAKGKKVEWINARNVRKEGILMPHYPHTMSSAKKHIPNHVKVKCAVQLTQAVKSLLDRNLVHLDIKPDNVFMNANYEVFLADLGGIREFTSPGQELKDWFKSFFVNVPKRNDIQTKGLIYTPGYCAPETVLGSVDHYSKSNLEKNIVVSLGKTFQEFFDDKPLALKVLIQKMISPEIAQRPKIEDVLNILNNLS